MPTLPAAFLPISSFFAPARSVLAMIFVVSLLAGLLMTACGGDESTLPPVDSSAPAGTAPTNASAGNAPAGSTSANAPAQSSGGQTSAPQQSAPATQPETEPINVVAGNAVLADLVANVGGDRVSVHSLVPIGSDAHTWNSTPQDSVRIAEAQVVVSNGAGLSTQVEGLIDNAASADAVRVVASEGLEPQELVELPFPEDDHGHGAEEGEAEAHGRLLIGDGETGALSVIDLESGAVHQDEFDLGSRAGRIYPTGSGRFAIAVSSDANAVHIFDGGIYLEEHGDHFDLVESDVHKLQTNLTGDRPSHLYVGEEWATVYYDGSGDIAFINEHELEHEGDAFTPVMMNAGAQHGAAIPLEGDLFAVSLQHPNYDQNPEEYRRPIGAEIRDLDGNVLYTAEGCPDLHGDASNGHMAAFGCTGGVLVVEADHGHYHHDFISGPAGSPDDFRLTSVWGYHGLDHFFALGSAVGLYIVEPEDGAMEQLIPASDELRPIQVALSYDGELLLVVMSDGEIRMYDAHDADLLASTDTVLSDDIDPSFWARPHIATAPGHIFITDSAAGEVLALDTHDLEVMEHWDVDGKPTKIAFVGILGEGDHPEQGHDDGHGHGSAMSGSDQHGQDDHGHDHGEGDPHFWLNPRMAVHYVNQIADGLAAADPGNASLYMDNAAAYIAELEALDAYIAEELSDIPQEHRVIVTFHDAFGYFGIRYDMEVMAFVGGHGGDVSPDDIARVLDLVNDEGLPAVFAESQFSDDALEQVARDAGVQVGIINSLPTDAYPDYISMMRASADALHDLLH